MTVKTIDCEAMMQAMYLLASVEKSQFTKEQLAIVDRGLEAAEAMRVTMERERASKREYMAKRRAEDPTYAQKNSVKATYTGKVGRPRKKKDE